MLQEYKRVEIIIIYIISLHIVLHELFLEELKSILDTCFLQAD